MVGNGAYRNAFLLSGMRNIPKAALAALEHLDRIAEKHRIELIEFAFPYPYGKVEQLNDKVGRKVNEMMAKYRATVHLPMAPIHKPGGMLEVCAGIGYGLEHGARQFVVHPAEVEWKRFWQKSTRFDFAEAQKNGLVNLKNILEDYRNEDITIGIENLAGPVPYGKTPTDFDYLFGKHGKLTAGLCFDTCHATNSGLDPAFMLGKYLLSGHLVEVHLTDTKIFNGPDKHCALGKGIVPLDAAWEVLGGFNGPVIVEIDNKDLATSWNWLMADR